MSAQAELIIFFDGVCNLCNASVQRVLLNDTKRYFRFASLQSDFTADFFDRHGFNKQVDSIILFDEGHFFVKSEAVLRIAGKLQFPYPLLKVFFIFPAFVRDPVYTFIARNRYRWFGKRESCMLPKPEYARLFLG